jgi:hypothetical protein
VAEVALLELCEFLVLADQAALTVGSTFRGRSRLGVVAGLLISTASHCCEIDPPSPERAAAASLSPCPLWSSMAFLNAT